MFENLPEREFDEAIQEMVDTLGVREDWTELSRFPSLNRENVTDCVAAIGRQFGLPVRFEVSCVSGDYKTDGFHSKALVSTDSSGRGRDSIAAEVCIPPDLPFFGSDLLRGLAIPVKLVEGCWLQPETLVTVLAHEMSHVLLRAMRHPRQASELHADLVPLVLGFRKVVDDGREVITARHTTRFGYLSEAQFKRAFWKVDGILDEFREKKTYALACASEGASLLERAALWLYEFTQCLFHLDAKPPKKMASAIARKIVECHQPDYTRDWETAISDGADLIERARRTVNGIEHYTNQSSSEIQKARLNLEAALPRLRAVAQAIESDGRLLRAQTGILYQLRTEPGETRTG